MKKQRMVPKPGEFYLHKKGKLYQVLTVARHSETLENLVIYQALYGDFKTYARPLTMFLDEENGQKRFEKVELNCEDSKTSATIEPVQDVGESESEEVSDALLKFLDAKGNKEKYDILCINENHISEVALDSIGLSLDFVLNSDTREGKLKEIKELLETKIKYEAVRR